MYIAVSGNLGSGKTTLARGLAHEFNCRLYPTRPYDESYIRDLFSNPERWSFEAQVGFLIHKFNQIQEGLRHGRLFVLDRTIDEDVNVFAEKFHDDGYIDDRSMELLKRIYSGVSKQLEPPRLIIFIECPAQICEQRIKDRPRAYQQLYPPDHIAKLGEKLERWLSSVAGVPIVKIDATENDFRHPNVIHDIAVEIDYLARRQHHTQQEDLFITTSTEKSIALTKLKILANNNHPIQLSERIRTPKKLYLAAPFTARAQKRNLAVPNRQTLFDGEESIESIPRSYRRTLSGLASAFEDHGYEVLLPHRDINRWGRRALPATEVADRCLDAIAACDYFVGLIGESFGSHVEMGMALGMDKPALLLVPDNVPISFFGAGVTGTGRVRVLKGRGLSEIIKKIRLQDPLHDMG